MTRICFLDCETTSLRPDRRAWEVGVIVRDPGKDDVECHRFVNTGDLDLGNADLSSLKIGRFHDRHPQSNGTDDPWSLIDSEYAVVREVERLTRGAVIVGVNPGFDTETLGARMRANGICPSWNYRIVDARTLAAGTLRMPPPWDASAILDAFGVSCAAEDQHTALGDARLARDLYDAVMVDDAPLLPYKTADGTVRVHRGDTPDTVCIEVEDGDYSPFDAEQIAGAILRGVRAARKCEKP